ncbi:MAG: signal peptidase II [Boseongicola sp.]
MRALTWTASVVFMIDQISKYAVVQLLDLKTRGVLSVLDPFLVFRMAWNEGINFGLFAGLGDLMRWVLVALALAISIWLIHWMWRDRPGRWVQISAGLVVGGAIGNVVDRVIYGAVADFLNMSCCGIENPWSFNVADIAIFVGAAGLILLAGDDPKSRDADDKAG